MSWLKHVFSLKQQSSNTYLHHGISTVAGAGKQRRWHRFSKQDKHSLPEGGFPNSFIIRVNTHPGGRFSPALTMKKNGGYKVFQSLLFTPKGNFGPF
ncbi:MAG: hypothetical protein ACO1NW_08880 [Chitinophagaceae bacterium]